MTNKIIQFFIVTIFFSEKIIVFLTDEKINFFYWKMAFRVNFFLFESVLQEAQVLPLLMDPTLLTILIIDFLVIYILLYIYTTIYTLYIHCIWNLKMACIKYIYSVYETLKFCTYTWIYTTLSIVKLTCSNIVSLRSLKSILIAYLYIWYI